MTLLTKASDLFDGLKPEKKQEQKEFKVDKNPVLEDMLKGFRAFLGEQNRGLPTFESSHYKKCKELLPKQYTAKDIEQFSKLLRIFHDRPGPFSTVANDAGLYLSSLINNSDEDRFIIHAYNSNLNNLGYQNTKHITVKGDIGWTLGKQMIEGEINVHGNANAFAGVTMHSGKILIHGDAEMMSGHDMDGGELIINGNTGEYIAHMMNNGKIVINGKAGNYVGNKMNGGEIHLNGECASIASTTEGGNIYHKGVQIVKDGKRVK